MAPPVPTVAAPAQQPATGTADPRYDEALARGRERFAAKDFAGAVTAFEDALTLAPDDPRASTELGWAALHAKDLAKAERALVDAIARAAEPSLAGAAWYNLGRLHEARGHRQDAIAAYVQSRLLRPNETVQRRLAKLKLVPEAKLDIETLAGPFPTIAAWCEHGMRELAVDRGLTALPDRPPPRCDETIASRDGLTVVQPSLAATAGILEAKFVATDEPMTGYLHYGLALRTAEGWFVRPAIGTDGVGGVGNVHAALTHLSFEPVDLVPGGDAELKVRVDESWLDLDMGDDISYEDERSDRLFCGIGPSGKPACTSPIPLVGASRERNGAGEGRAKHVERWAMKLSLARGKVVLRGDASAVDAPHRAWLGSHAIAFP